MKAQREHVVPLGKPAIRIIERCRELRARDWLGVQIEELGRVVLAVCSERIAELTAGVKQAG